MNLIYLNERRQYVEAFPNDEGVIVLPEKNLICGFVDAGKMWAISDPNNTILRPFEIFVMFQDMSIDFIKDTHFAQEGRKVDLNGVGFCELKVLGICTTFKSVRQQMVDEFNLEFPNTVLQDGVRFYHHLDVFHKNGIPYVPVKMTIVKKDKDVAITKPLDYFPVSPYLYLHYLSQEENGVGVDFDIEFFDNYDNRLMSRFTPPYTHEAPRQDFIVSYTDNYFGAVIPDSYIVDPENGNFPVLQEEVSKAGYEIEKIDLMGLAFVYLAINENFLAIEPDAVVFEVIISGDVQSVEDLQLVYNKPAAEGGGMATIVGLAGWPDLSLENRLYMPLGVDGSEGAGTVSATVRKNGVNYSQPLITVLDYETKVLEIIV